MLDTKAKISDKINQIKQKLNLARNRIEKDQGECNTAKKDVESSIMITVKTSSNLEKMKALKIVLPTYIISVARIKQIESLINDLSKKRPDFEEHAASHMVNI